MSTSANGRASRRGGLRVADLAAATGLTPDAVRYYERAGLLPPPPRTPGGYRLYGDDAVERIGFIQGCQRLGLRLREIADLLAVRDTGTCPCEPAGGLLERRLAEVDAEIARLTALRGQLVQMLDGLAAPACGPADAVVAWCPPDREEVRT